MDTPRFPSDSRNILIIAAFILVVYFNALRNGFVWVDQFQIVDRGLIVGNFKELVKVFTTNMDYQFKSLAEKGDYYRPLVNVSFTIDHILWKFNPLGYHLSSILLHLLSTILIYKIFVLLFKDRLASLLSCVLFAVHPVLPASVTWISGRADPLCALFFLGSLYLYMRATEEKAQATARLLGWLSLLSFFCALLSKEMAITLPVLIAVYYYLFLRGKKSSLSVLYLFRFFAIAAVYLVMRKVITHGVGAGLPLFRGDFYQTSLTMSKVICDYLGLCVMPDILTISDAARVYDSIIYPQVLLSLSAIGLLLVLAVLAARKHKEVTFAVMWFFITLFPIMNVIPAKHFRAERFLYIPYIGLFLLLAAALSYLLKSGRHRAAVVVCSVLLIFSFSCRTVWRNTDFKDDYTLFTRTISTSPYCNEAHLVFANLNLKINNLPVAINEYYKALSPNAGYITYKSYYEANNNLGLALARSGYLDGAIDHFKEAYKLCPDCSEAGENLRIALDKKQQIKGEYAK